MRKSGLQGLVVVGLLALVGATLIALWWPVVSTTRIVGWQGVMADDSYLITAIYRGSPAETAGIRLGDRISGLAGDPIGAWYTDMLRDYDAYLRRLLALGPGPVEVSLSSAEGTTRAVAIVRRLEADEILRLYLLSLVLAAILVALAMVVVASSPRDPIAFLACISFSLLALWVSSGQRMTLDRFLPPLVPDFGSPVTVAAENAQFFVLPLLLSSILHTSLRFPVNREPPDWLLTAVYAAPVLLLLGVMMLQDGSWLARLESVYPLRRWLATGCLLASVVLLVAGLRDCRSPVRRLQSRWIVGAMLVVAVTVIGLWNLPLLLFDKPLVPDYDWILLSVMLIPLTVTMSISSHRLFGLRGMIRRRLRVLDQQLKRERSHVERRDREVIRLTREIDTLRTDLASYGSAEQLEMRADASEALARLEQQHPVIREVRGQRLLGTSPFWQRIFEDAVLAASGTAPVLLVGESGTGKTDLAWTIHALGSRNQGPYRAVSCAQFEHADPAFALGRLFGIGSGHGLPNVPAAGQPGLLEECEGGTLLLDDFDRLPLNVQDLLLYPLDGQPFEPGIGRGAARRVDVKFILATNREPAELVGEGRLRADVLARLGARVDIPPLRHRREDIPLLVEHFASGIAHELGHEIAQISPKVINELTARDYADGNARELRAELRAAIGRAMLAGDRELRAGHLERSHREPVVSAPVDTGSVVDESPAVKRVHPGDLETQPGAREIAVLRHNRFNMHQSERELGYSHKSRTLSHHFRGICLQSLRANGWEVAAAARALSADDDRAIVARLERRLHGMLATIRNNIEQGTERRLFRNLPACYHDALEAAIAFTRGSGPAERD